MQRLQELLNPARKRRGRGSAARIAPPPPRWHAGRLSENAGEMALVGKAAGCGDVGQAQRRVQQQRLRMVLCRQGDGIRIHGKPRGSGCHLIRGNLDRSGPRLEPWPSQERLSIAHHAALLARYTVHAINPRPTSINGGSAGGLQSVVLRCAEKGCLQICQGFVDPVVTLALQILPHK